MVVIQTGRLRLRPITIDDVEAVLSYRSLPEVSTYIYQPVFDRQKAVENVELSVAAVADPESGIMRFMIERLDTGEMVGDAMIGRDAELTGSYEVGYVIHPAQAGHGFATEAARAAIEFGFAALGAHRVYARVDEDNIPSMRICQRLGMRQEARLIENDWRDDAWSNEVIFAIVDREWRDQLRDA